jgi:hypothetical protein
LKIKKNLRTKAEGESLIPKKEKNFYQDHIDVILRENYVSSDSEEEELASKIKAARINTAASASRAGGGGGGSRGQGAGRSRGQTGGSTADSEFPEAPSGESGVKLPAISNKTMGTTNSSTTK